MAREARRGGDDRPPPEERRLLFRPMVVELPDLGRPWIYSKIFPHRTVEARSRQIKTEIKKVRSVVVMEGPNLRKREAIGGLPFFQ